MAGLFTVNVIIAVQRTYLTVCEPIERASGRIRPEIIFLPGQVAKMGRA